MTGSSARSRNDEGMEASCPGDHSRARKDLESTQSSEQLADEDRLQRAGLSH